VINDKQRPSVSLITYDIPHKKTQDVLSRLMLLDRYSLSLTLVPFKPRPEREVLFQHRPVQRTGPDPYRLAQAHGVETFHLGDWRSFHPQIDYFLVCGAGLLEGEFCESAQILNVHPGLIPQTRGLDSFKWCIHQRQRLGNTLHRIDAGVDLGTVFHHRLTDVVQQDDIAALALRHYNAEVDLLINFEGHLTGGTVLPLDTGEPTKRMPASVEAQMLKNFAGFKRKFAVPDDGPG